MRKLILMLGFLMMAQVCFAADIWTYRLTKIIYSQSLIHIEAEVSLNGNSVSSMTLELPDIPGTTKVEKLTFIKSRLEEKITPIVNAYKTAKLLESYVGTEVVIP